VMERYTILDMDPGIDDALAIIFAGKVLRRVDAICVCAGNVDVDTAYVNAKKIAGFAGLGEIVIGKGPEKPLCGEWQVAEDFHGEDGLGGVAELLPTPETHVFEGEAHQLIRYFAERGKLDIIATGPLTNIALFCREFPELIESVERLIIMGGAYFKGGNVTRWAEFNIYTDPEAADIVFNAPFKRILALGLDVTERVCLKNAHLPEPRDRKEEIIHQMINSYIDAHMLFNGVDGCFLHDPLAVGVARREDFIRARQYGVRVVLDGQRRGVTEISEGGGVEIAVDVKAGEFIKFFLANVFGVEN